MTACVNNKGFVCIMESKFKMILTCFGALVGVFLVSITLSLKAMSSGSENMDRTVALMENIQLQKARTDVLDSHIIYISRNIEDLKNNIKEMRTELKSELIKR